MSRVSQPTVVEGRGERQYAVGRHGPVGRAESDKALVGGRDPDGACGIGAEPDLGLAEGDGPRPGRRRAAAEPGPGRAAFGAVP